jgi:hypothetical protein
VLGVHSNAKLGAPKVYTSKSDPILSLTPKNAPHVKCPQIVADDGFSMCHMYKNLGFIFAPVITFWCFAGLHFGAL